MEADLVRAARALDAHVATRLPCIVVLLADSPHALWVKRTLRGDYDVAVAGEERDAVRTCRARAASALIASLGLPGLDPLRMIKALRRDPRTAGVKVFFTARIVPPNAMELVIEAGATDFLFQPFGAVELKARLRSRLDFSVPTRPAEPAHGAGLESGRWALRRLAWENVKLHRTAIEAAALKDEALALVTSVLMSAPLGFCLMDTRLRLVRYNARFAHLSGLRPGDHSGMMLSSLLPGPVAQQIELAAARASVSSRTSDELTFALLDASGEARHVVASFYPVRNGPRIFGVGILLVDVTERARAEIALRASNDRISELLRLKDRFFAAISHELRTPLAAIEMWSHALLRPDANGAAVERAASAIRQSARAQSRIIEDLVDLSRVVTGQFTLVHEPVDLRRVLGDVVESLRPQIAAKKIRLRRSLSRNVDAPFGDAARLAQVFKNILTNAIAFTPARGTIRVALEVAASAPEGRDGPTARVSVHDTGPGIPPDLLPHIFEPFRSGRPAGGFGLGLAIAQHIVRLHGGEITVDNGPASGACFDVWLPLDADPPTSGPRPRLLGGRTAPHGGARQISR